MMALKQENSHLKNNNLTEEYQAYNANCSYATALLNKIETINATSIVEQSKNHRKKKQTRYAAC